jgi:3-hydroxyisobutyrate dehydrogenase
VLAPNARIAFIGLGRMGLPMCARLAAAGFEVVATDLRAELRGAVTRWADSIQEACAGAEVAVTMLPGPESVADAAAPIISSLDAGAVWIDMSTASPSVANEITGGDSRFLDAPVGGSPETARVGRLVAFVGGAAGDLARCRPLFDALTERVFHVGPAGSGYAVKLLVNALWFAQAAATAEALALGDRLGLDLHTVHAALSRSAAASRFISRDVPALLDGDDLTDFSLGRCCEELASVLALGEQCGVPLDVLSTVSALHRGALEQYGDADGELLGARWVAERAGVRLRREAQAQPSAAPQRLNSE